MASRIKPPIVFGFHGTSLTAGRLACPDKNWVEYFLADMRAQPECKGQVIGYNTGKGSQTSDWGAANAYVLAALRPTHILFEGFGINDCAIGPVSLAQAAANFDSMVATWRAGNPAVDLTHQTMSPAASTDSLRTTLQDYYDQELARAVVNGVASLNHTPDCAPIDGSNTNGAGTSDPSGFATWGGGTATPDGGTFNPADKNVNVALSNGNLTMSVASATVSGVRGSYGPGSGKHYAEFVVDAVGAGVSIGFGTSTMSLANGAYVGSDSNGVGLRSTGGIWTGGAQVAAVEGFTTGDIIGIARDFGAATMWFAKNGAWLSGDPSTGVGGVSGSAVQTFAAAAAAGGGQVTANFLTLNSQAGDKLHPLWATYFSLYEYPTIRAWGIAKMAAHWA